MSDNAYELPDLALELVHLQGQIAATAAQLRELLQSTDSFTASPQDDPSTPQLFNFTDMLNRIAILRAEYSDTENEWLIDSCRLIVIQRAHAVHARLLMEQIEMLSTHMRKLRQIEINGGTSTTLGNRCNRITQDGVPASAARHVQQFFEIEEANAIRRVVDQFAAAFLSDMESDKAAEETVGRVDTNTETGGAS